jgi:hydroxymethylglutaryl-CoA reductase
VSKSRISGFRRLGVGQRIRELQQLGWLSEADAESLRHGKHVMAPTAADRIIENVIGVFGLPFAIAPNFIINGKDYIVPMVVEEPSIVAGTSFAAQLARASGGVHTECEESLLAGQVHVTGIDDVEAALAAINRAVPEILELANAVHPRLVQRGGGVREVEVHLLELRDSSAAIAIHLLVDTCDAMGANLVNTMCEAVSPRIAELCESRAALRILTNLTDRALVTARVRYDLSRLATPGFAAESVRDRIVLASDIAAADPYRAATHNKGIMNGVDAVAIATGNDWRAIEAGAHAYAAASGSYRPLAVWSSDDNGDLVGEMTIPMKVGIVGGTTEANAAAALGLRITAVGSATELAELLAAVGLLQNFAALRALATSGIQAGHMKLHERKETLKANAVETEPGPALPAQAAGKVILLGEHAVVYGRHALALPISGAVSAAVSVNPGQTTVQIPDWGVDMPVTADEPSGIGAALLLIMQELGVDDRHFSIRMQTVLPRAMGLGSSAAFAVAIVRAFDAELNLGLSDDSVNAIAFKCEQLAHGTPSGIDNTIATFDRPMLFRKGDELEMKQLQLQEVPPIVIACSHSSGLTLEQVAGVRTRYDRNTSHYESIFDEVDALSREGARSLLAGDYGRLGDLMNICHGLLNAIEVSTPELESMVSLARKSGAAGAKLTGAGGGGSIVALCPGKVDEVRAAFAASGFQSILLAGSKDDGNE